MNKKTKEMTATEYISVLCAYEKGNKLRITARWVHLSSYIEYMHGAATVVFCCHQGGWVFWEKNQSKSTAWLLIYREKSEHIQTVYQWIIPGMPRTALSTSKKLFTDVTNFVILIENNHAYLLYLGCYSTYITHNMLVIGRLAVLCSVCHTTLKWND